MKTIQERLSELKGKVWKNQMWLMSIPLNSATAFDYFAQSIFYDKMCNNEVAKAQNIELNKLKGLEYASVKLKPEESRLFVITMRYRHSQSQTETLAYYYIIDGEVFQAPSLGDLLLKRVANLEKALSMTYTTLKKFEQEERDDQQGEEEIEKLSQKEIQDLNKIRVILEN